MAFNQEAFLAALEQARQALDGIELAAAAQPPEEEPAIEEAAEGEAPPMPPMRKPMMGE